MVRWSAVLMCPLNGWIVFELPKARSRHLLAIGASLGNILISEIDLLISPRRQLVGCCFVAMFVKSPPHEVQAAALRDGDVCLFVRLFICLFNYRPKRVRKTRFFWKTNRFRAVFYGRPTGSHTWLFKEPIGPASPRAPLMAVGAYRVDTSGRYPWYHYNITVKRLNLVSWNWPQYAGNDSRIIALTL